jgi:hypothetical protein
LIDQNKKRQDNGKGDVNPVAAAVTGAVFGAAAVAGAVALKDKKNREKVKKVLINIKDHATRQMKDMQKHGQKKGDEIEKKLAEGKNKVEKVANSATGSLHQVSDKIKKATK